MSETTTKPTLADAVAALVSVCDGARMLDGVGFSGVDAAFGRSLAQVPEGAWDAATKRVAWVTLRKYRRQLDNYGIDFDAIPEPEAVDADRQHAVTAASKTVRFNGSFEIRFRYDPKLVEAVKTIPGRRFTNNGAEKFWTAPATSAAAVLAFASKHSFAVIGEVPEPEPDEAVAEVAAPPRGHIGVEGGKFTVFFGEHPGREALEVVRAIPGREWYPPTRTWLVPVRGNTARVIAMARRFGLTLPENIEQAAREIETKAQALHNASSAADADLHVEGLSEHLSLLPYQRAGVAYMSQVKRGFFADEMGLGKTVQSIATVVHANAYPVICVVPASLKLNWKREWEMWVPGVQAEIISGTKPGQISRLFPPQVIIINYDILGRYDAETDTTYGHLEDLVGIGAKALIIDECHYVKSPKANRTQAMLRLARSLPKDGYVMGLSGTPLVNRPAELVAQLEILGRLHEFGGPNRYKSRYCQNTAASNARLPELNDRLRASCYVRRLKQDVLTELPPKRRSLMPVETDRKIMEQYAKAEADVVTFLARRAHELALESGLDDDAARQAYWEKMMRARSAEHLVLIGTLKILAARAKLPAAVAWVKNFLSSGSKLVLFADHREIVDALVDAFPGSVKIQGGQSAASKDAAVTAFQTDPECRLIVCSMQAAGVGLTLTAASDVAFLEQGWTPAGHAQCEDRCHRIGQGDSVTAWYLLAQGTIDEQIAALIADKAKVVDAVTDGKVPEEGNESVLGQLLVGLAHKGLSQEGAA